MVLLATVSDSFLRICPYVFVWFNISRESMIGSNVVRKHGLIIIVVNGQRLSVRSELIVVKSFDLSFLMNVLVFVRSSESKLVFRHVLHP